MDRQTELFVHVTHNFEDLENSDRNLKWYECQKHERVDDIIMSDFSPVRVENSCAHCVDQSSQPVHFGKQHEIMICPTSIQKQPYLGGHSETPKEVRFEQQVDEHSFKGMLPLFTDISQTPTNSKPEEQISSRGSMANRYTRNCTEDQSSSVVYVIPLCLAIALANPLLFPFVVYYCARAHQKCQAMRYGSGVRYLNRAAGIALLGFVLILFPAVSAGFLIKYADPGNDVAAHRPENYLQSFNLKTTTATEHIRQTTPLITMSTATLASVYTAEDSKEEGSSTRKPIDTSRALHAWKQLNG